MLPPAEGWIEVLETFNSDHKSQMRAYPKRLMVLLIDFDNNQKVSYEERLSYAKGKITDEFWARVFVLGVVSEPEKLEGSSYAEIGRRLALDCRDQTKFMWGHDLLKHNQAEIVRIQSHPTWADLGV